MKQSLIRNLEKVFQAQIASLESENLNLIQEKNEAESRLVELNLELNNKMSSITDLESRLEIKSSKSPIPVTGTN